MTVRCYARVSSYAHRALDRGWDVSMAGANDLALLDAPLGTVAQLLRWAGRWFLDGPPRRFDAERWEYRLRFDAPAIDAGDDLVLGFDGLATLAQAELNGEPLLVSRSMFIAHECQIARRVQQRGNELVLRFDALDIALAQRRLRPRWRVPMVEHQQLRWLRTTLLGRTPGWSPPAAPVGPWRDVWLEHRRGIALGDLHIQTAVEGSAGIVSISCLIKPLGARSIASAVLELERDGRSWRAALSYAGADGIFNGQLAVDRAELWWPHTHGEPALYAARLRVQLEGERQQVDVELGAIGFRTVVINGERDDFALRVNGTPVFCRGACWAPLDVVSLRATPAAYADAVAQVRDAGMNMLRIPGTMVYEEDAFYDACDALGVLVWQDFMFANFDYPADDEAFVEDVRTEIQQQLARWQPRPSLAVLCGNSEVEQQAAMWGMPRGHWRAPLFDELIASYVREMLPGVPYWPSSAHGGAFPHQPSAGTSSYYGVGAYLRPPDDAHASRLRFATECLALANVPEDATIERMPGAHALRVHHPGWKARTPRDLHAGWDFDDVRDHYMRLLFGLDPVQLRQIDHARYLDLSRAVGGELMASAFAQWRRNDSCCRGALVWLLRDLWPGAGWGLLDDRGKPKPCWHAVKRVLQSRLVSIADDGLNGLTLHVDNDAPQALEAMVRLSAYNDADAAIAQWHRSVQLPPHTRWSEPLAAGLDGFIDLGQAYRFGPAPARVVVARLVEPDDALIGEAFHFALGLPYHREPELGLSAVARRVGSVWQLDLRTQRFALAVRIAPNEGYEPLDNWFHMAPGSVRTVPLRQVTPGLDAEPRGWVRPLNAWKDVAIEVRAQ